LVVRKVAAYTLRGNGLAERVVPYMVQGARAIGFTVDTFSDTAFCPAHLEEYDVAVFWGYVETCQAIMAGYRDAGKAAVYLDLGYWRRDEYFKVSVNDRHPTAYFQIVQHNSERRSRFVDRIAPYRVREHILLAGMPVKAAWAEKLEPTGSWELAAVAELRKHTDKPIIYRPKPTWRGPAIPGTIYTTFPDLAVELAKSYCVVTHHSNVAVDGLQEGLAVFATKGVASVMGTSDLSKINDPLYPDEREQFFNDVSYCQWSVAEMKNGTAWCHLLGEELI
jgi:hypothetical protein